MPAITTFVLVICRNDDGGSNGGVSGRGKGWDLLRDVRFADDQGMVENTEKGLQKIMDRLYDTAKAYDVKINIDKKTL